MRKLFIIISLWLTALSAYAQWDVDSILHQLMATIERRDYYYTLREVRIDSLKQLKQIVPEANMERSFALNHQLFDEYKSYQSDSAKAYAYRLQEIARRAASPTLTAEANRALLFAYISGGLFKEADDVIEDTDLSQVDNDTKADFYFLCIRLYSDMSNYVNAGFENEYVARSHAYADSVIAYKNPDSYEVAYAQAFKTIDNLKIDDKIALFKALAERTDIDQGEKAMFYSMLADFYSMQGNSDGRTFNKAQAAIYDIQSAKHETTASRDLALYLYECGQLDEASRLIHLALDDANFYNARHRKMEINNVLPLIEQKRYDSVFSQRNLLIILIIIAGALLIALSVAIFYILRQMKSLRRSREEIAQQAEALSSAQHEITQRNAELQESNDKLRESIKIKDEYIGYGFSVSSHYIEKIESLYKLVDRKLAAKQYDDLRMTLKKKDLREDKETIQRDFDRIFLHLFPSFITSYNRLFPDDTSSAASSTAAEPTERRLTSEMRIFALIRLGITDSATIATLLNYSVNTVNTYKTKAKNRSLVPNEEFERKILEIRSID
ncbi:MAG: DUF6377 domain-containing protein [Bacteroidales bacterium]|nr:DUF6377 domain-containing protein [Bacteroidales bacterium]